MKRIVTVLAAVLVGAVLVEAQNRTQRVPITISGTQIQQPVVGAASTSRLVTSNIVSASGNQLVLVVDLDTNSMAIEEWDANLSNRVDRTTLIPGTQSVVWVTADYGAMAKSYNTRSNTVSFATVFFEYDPGGLGGGDADWDDEGTADHFGAVALVGTLSYNPTAVLTNRTTSALITGVVTRVSATLQGPMNDALGGEDTPELQLRNGRVRSTGKAFAVGN